MRDAYFDNARLWLMVLVVVGHAVEPLATAALPGLAAQPWAASFYRALYLFHMPLFAWLSGYFAPGPQSGAPPPSPTSPSPASHVAPARVDALEGLGKTAARLLVPYLLFQLLYQAFDAWLFRHPFELRLLQPYWLLWFLVSLCCWRALLLPFSAVFSRFAAPPRRSGPAALLLLGLAVLAALLAGTVDAIGYRYSLSRTLVFFPAFLLGWLAARSGWRPSTAPWLRLVGLAVLGAALGVGTSTVSQRLAGLDVRWLYGSLGYLALGASALEGALLRLVLMLASLALALALLAWVPTSPSRLTTLGSRTLYPFLVHGFAVKLFWAKASDFGGAHPGLVSLGAAGLTLLLCSPWATRLLRPLVEPLRR